MKFSLLCICTLQFCPCRTNQMSKNGTCYTVGYIYLYGIQHRIVYESHITSGIVILLPFRVLKCDKEAKAHKH